MSRSIYPGTLNNLPSNPFNRSSSLGINELGFYLAILFCLKTSISKSEAVPMSQVMVLASWVSLSPEGAAAVSEPVAAGALLSPDFVF